MGSKTNRYRSNKNPHQQVLVTPLEGDQQGQYAVAVVDWAQGRISQATAGAPPAPPAPDEPRPGRRGGGLKT